MSKNPFSINILNEKQIQIIQGKDIVVTTVSSKSKAQKLIKFISSKGCFEGALPLFLLKRH